MFIYYVSLDKLMKLLAFSVFITSSPIIIIIFTSIKVGVMVGFILHSSVFRLTSKKKVSFKKIAKF